MTNCNEEVNASNLFTGKVILAPMVRQNSLPFRLICLDYGADLVYTEELIDYRLSSCRRLENIFLDTIDFVDDRGEVILRTTRGEKDKLVVQLGSNNPERALKAARLVSKDVLAIDFNFGCPKAFSLTGGMGAALLEKPEQIKALLTKCVQNLDIPVTCKIRILPNLDETIKLVKMIESCGVAAIAVHGRTKEQRPHDENQVSFIRNIANSISIPVIANGGSSHIKHYSDIIKFKEESGASSVMIARAAMRNPSIFKSSGSMEQINDVIDSFLELAVRYNNYFASTKYSLQAMMASQRLGGKLTSEMHACVDYDSLCSIFGKADWYAKNRIIEDKLKFYGDGYADATLRILLNEKKSSLKSKGIDLICDSIPYIPRFYEFKAPKSLLMDSVNRDIHNRPKFDVFQLRNRSYHCIVTHRNKCYLNETPSSSKKNSEHATALLVCQHMHLIDLEEYKSRACCNSKNIN